MRSQHERTNNKRFKRKTIKYVAGTLVTLSLLIGTVFTVAYFHSESNFTNPFTTPSYGVSLNEDFTPIDNWAPGIDKDKVVWVENNGGTDVFVRMKYTEVWTDHSGKGQDLDEEAVIENWTDAWKNDWVQIGDWWYYTKVLTAGTQTDPILSSLTLDPSVSNDDHALDYGQAEYTLTFDQEDMQAEADPQHAGWNVSASVDDSGNVTWTPFSGP